MRSMEGRLRAAQSAKSPMAPFSINRRELLATDADRWSFCIRYAVTGLGTRLATSGTTSP